MKKIIFVLLLFPFLSLAQPLDPAGDVDHPTEQVDEFTKRIERVKAQIKLVLDRVRKRLKFLG